MKKVWICVFGVAIVACMLFGGCTNTHAEAFQYNGFETALPDLSGLTSDNYVADETEKEKANAAGWYPTLIDNFDYTPDYASNHGLNPEIWTTSPHGLRWASNSKSHPEYTNYWCDDLVSVTADGYAVVRAEYRQTHACDVCAAVEIANKQAGDTRGRYTGGFETRRVRNKLGDDGQPIYNNIGRPIQEDDILWGQAFGYYETRVRFPRKLGMWSAFWLQSTYQRKIGNDGMDGTEIDVFESAFLSANDKISRMGHALLWDGYAAEGRSEGKIFALGDNDLYDGEFHTFALLWTPTHYVFYIDGQATWATDAGGVAQVAEFLRFTCEIDAGDGWGPHGMRIGQFDHDGGAGMFEIDYVRVYQNTSYLSHIRQDSDYEGEYTTDN